MDDPNSSTFCKYLDRPTEVVTEKPIRYTPARADGYLTVPDGEGDYLRKPFQPPPIRAGNFRVIKESGVLAVGFRSYVSEDGRFFNDATILDDGFKPDLIRKFATGQLEDTKCSLDEVGAHFPDLKPAVVVDEPVICLGSDEPTNYGSLIYRILPKLMAMPDRWRMPILVCHQFPWIKDLFQTVFGDIELRQHVGWQRHRIKEAYIPTLRNNGIYFDDETIEFYRQRAATIKGRSSHERVYLSRQAAARKRPGFRVLLNELELIAELEKHGYTAIEPEQLPFEDQWRIVRDAKSIVCPGGSGLFNMVFATNADHVLDLEPSRGWVHGHHSLLKSARLNHTILFGTQPDPSVAHSSWRIDIPSVIRAIQ